MISFHVTVRTETARITYTAIADYSFDIAEAAIDLFGICSVSVVPA